MAGTGGAGQHRGGNGVDVAYRFLEPGTIAINDDRCEEETGLPAPIRPVWR